MYPILLDLAKVRVALAGNGEATLRRLGQLDADGAAHLTVYADSPSPALAAAAGERLRRAMPRPAEIAGAHIVFAAGLDETRFEPICAAAHAAGVLLHAEDRPALGQVHAPAMLRRGDLLITVSTNGASPGLAGRLKDVIGRIFGPDWDGRVAEIASLRRGWRKAGAGLSEIRRWTDAWLDRVAGDAFPPSAIEAAAHPDRKDDARQA